MNFSIEGIKQVFEHCAGQSSVDNTLEISGKKRDQKSFLSIIYAASRCLLNFKYETGQFYSCFMKLGIKANTTECLHSCTANYRRDALTFR